MSLLLNRSEYYGWKLYSTPQGALQSGEGDVKAEVDPVMITHLPPPIRMNPPLPQLCILAGPSIHEQVDRVVETQMHYGSIIDSLASGAPSFSPCVRLTSARQSQETKQNLCNVSFESCCSFNTRFLLAKYFSH